MNTSLLKELIEIEYGYRNTIDCKVSDNKKCAICGHDVALINHHVFARLYKCGKVNNKFGLLGEITLCPNCHFIVHGAKHDKTMFTKYTKEKVEWEKKLIQ